METQAINDQDPLVNYDNDNENDDLGYQSGEEYGKPDGIKLSVTIDALNMISRKHKALFSSFLGDMVREHIGLKILSWKKVDSEARNKLWDEITVKSTANKMARSKFIYQHTMGRGGYALVKEKMKETNDKIKEGTLKVDHGTDAMTVVLGKEKGGYARGVRSGVTYKRYSDLPRSRQASDERILLLQSELDNERRERQEKELLIQNLSNKMSQTEGMVTKLKNQVAAQGGQLQSITDEEGETIVVGCENDASIQKSNGLATLEMEMETRTDGKQMLHNKELPKDCYKVSIDTSLVDAACIPDVGNNGFKTV
nr:hypothetical protein [Tanacetum cinerariifolium]